MIIKSLVKPLIQPLSIPISGSPGFSPLDLSPIAWARSSISTLYQDSTGITPVTGAEQDVGLLLDFSQSATLGPELAASETIVSSPIGESDVQTLVSGLTIGKWYRVSLDVTGYDGTGGVGLVTSTDAFNAVAGAIRVKSGNDSIYFLGKASNTSQRLFTNSTNTAVFTNISVKEIAGDHFAQVTGTARPTYGTRPVSGRRNLLQWTEDFTNAVWGIQTGGTGTAPTVTANAGLSPNGEMTADRIQLNLNGGTTSGDVSRLRQSSEMAEEGNGSIYVKSFDGNPYTISFYAGGSTIDYVVTSEWVRIEAPSVALGPAGFDIQLRGARPIANSDFADILVWGAQREPGPSVTAYQKVESDQVVTEEGVEQIYFLQYDPDDALSCTLPAISGGQIVIISPAGTFIRDFDFAGGTFTVGPDTYTGGPAGLMSLLGNEEIEIIILPTPMTEAEQAKMVAYAQGLGSAGLITFDTDQVVNFGTNTGAWSGGASVTLLGSQTVELDYGANSNSYFNFIGTNPEFEANLVSGKMYLAYVEYQTDSTTNTFPQIQAGTGVAAGATKSSDGWVTLHGLITGGATNRLSAYCDDATTRVVRWRNLTVREVIMP